MGAIGPLILSLLGGFEARIGSGSPLAVPTKKAQGLLAYLALTQDQTHPRDKLAALLWGDQAPGSARNALRQTLFVLRKALGSEARAMLVITSDAITLAPDVVQTDVASFLQALAERTPAALERAAALYRGDLLAGLTVAEPAFEDWLMSERERLRELALEALARLLAHQLATGAAAAGVQTALQLLALDPLQESAHRALMRLYGQLARRDAALRQYQQCVEVLQHELGVEPERETKALYQELLRQRPRQAAVLLSAAARPADPPLVGRGTEVTRLHEALTAAWAGHGQVVAVVGEAGIGKTRLAEEVAAEASRRGALVLLGRSYESEQILPFGPWADAVRRGNVFADAAALASLGTSWRVELARLFPEVAQTGVVPPIEPTEYLRLFEAVTRLLECLADRRPLTLILEDLHWADDMSLRLLAFVGRRVHQWCAVVLGTARAEEMPDAAALGHAVRELQRERRLVEISLSPLSRGETLALVRTLAPARTEEGGLVRLGEQVWTMSEGNPFMIVQATRAIGEGTAPATSRIPLPERIRKVVTERMDRLGEDSRHLAAVAAVIGREFEFALVQQAAALDELKAAQGVEELVRRRVLREAGEHFQFAHDWIREATIAQLLPAHRKLLHRRVAEALEAINADLLEPHYAVLGHHYLHGETWGKAVTYLRLAGAQAAVRSAHREAVGHFERTLIALRHLPATRETSEQGIDTRFDLRNSLMPLGDLRHLDLLREAESLAVTIGDQRREARALSYITEYFFHVGEPDRAVVAGERALALADDVGDLAVEITTNRHLGRVFLVRGDYRQAIERLSGVVARLSGDLLHERFGSPAIAAAFARTWLASSRADLGDFEEALAIAEEGLRIAEAADHPLSIMFAHLGVGLVHLEWGDAEKAVASLDQSLSLVRTWEFSVAAVPVSSALGAAHALAGRAAEAIPLLETAVAEAETGGRLADQSLRVTRLGDAYLRAGRVADAAPLAERAVMLARTHKERGREAAALRLLGDVHAHPDRLDADAAERSYREGLALAESLGMRPLAGRCHLGLARLLRGTGNYGGAEEHRSMAVTLFRNLGMTSWLVQACPEPQPSSAT